MSQCFQPQCQQSNPDTVDFCQKCGRELWLWGRYRMKYTIGQGGFGRTYLAENSQHQLCVVKQFIYQGHNQAKARELFAQEAQQLKQLGEHPQIPTLYDYGEHQGVPYLVQEYIDGGNLAQEKAVEGCFSEIKIRQLLLDLLPVLEYVHQARVIHRDIKPENIIRRNSDRQLVLVDFGASKQVLGGAVSKTGTVIGSLETTAPEQLRGKPVYASDLYSLSITCLRLLLDHSPYEWKNQYEQWVWQNLLGDRPFSPALSAIINRGLAPLAFRYQSAGEMWSAVQSINHHTAPTILNGEPQTAQPELLTETITKYQRKLAFTKVRPRGVLLALWAGLMLTITWLILQPQLGQIAPHEYWQRATARFNQGDYQGAIADLDQLLQAQPNNAPAYNNRGLAKHNLRDHLGAIADYDRAITLNPRDSYAYFNRGNARYALADYQGAIQDYDSALRFNPQDALSLVYRGNAYYAVQNYRQAIQDYDRAIALQPQDYRSYFYRANSQVALLNYAQAIDDYSQAITLKPDYAPAYFYRADAYQAIQYQARAIADFGKAEQLFQAQGNSEWHKSAKIRRQQLITPQS